MPGLASRESPSPRRIGALSLVLATALAFGCGGRTDGPDGGAGEDAATPDVGSRDAATAAGDAAAAGGDAAAADAAAASDGSTPGDGGVGTIAIYVAGDLTPVVYGDGLAGQTPYDYQIALSRYDILLGATDPSPVLCFDLGATPFVVEVDKDNLVGSCVTAAVPSGTYTYGRTTIDWARYTVDGVYHYLDQQLPGKFVYFRAYSDTVYDGKAYAAGTGTVTFIGATAAEYPVVYGPPPNVAGVRFDIVGGKCLMTFPYTRPLPIDQSNTGAHWARFHWKIWESFRWTDAAWSGYQTGVWDVAPGGIETVGLYGVSSYYVTSSID
jgi:hypothetical protein